MSWAEHLVRMGDRRRAYRVLVRRPEGKRPLRKTWRRREDNIKMDLQEEGWSMDWIELTQNRDKWRALVNAVMNFKVIIFVNFLYRSTPFFTPSEHTALINTNIKYASPTCFGTSAPSCGRTK
jgi:hypothetical protein